MAFTSTSLPLDLYTSVFGFEQKFWRIDGFGEKKARIGGFPYPYSPPPTPVLHGAAKSHCFTVGCIPENTELYALLSLAVSP